jgi:hypothetical protein
MREIVTTTRRFADEELHTSLRSNLRVVFGWPCLHELLTKRQLAHRILCVVSSRYWIVYALLACITHKSCGNIGLWSNIAADILS